MENNLNELVIAPGINQSTRSSVCEITNIYLKKSSKDSNQRRPYSKTTTHQRHAAKMDPDQKISGYSVPRFVKNLGVPSRWIYSSLKAELLAFADKLGFSAEGVVDDLRRNFVTLVRDSEQTQEVWARLADLARQFTSRAPSPEPRTFGGRQIWP